MNILLWIENSAVEGIQVVFNQLEKMYGTLQFERFTTEKIDSSCILGKKSLKFVAKSDVKNVSCDVILVIGKNVNREKVLDECIALGIDDSKVLFEFEVCIPGFTIMKSNKLHRSKISVFSINNFGYRLCQRFSIPHCSPFSRSVLTAKDWMIFLESPQEHLSRQFIFSEKIKDATGKEYPVFQMGKNGLNVCMLDDTDIEKLILEWKRGIEKINWNDLLVVMYTDSIDILNHFDRLPYAKKVCFTSFESPLASAFYLPMEKGENDEDFPLWVSVNRLIDTDKPCYDLWDMLLYGKRTRIQYIN